MSKSNNGRTGIARLFTANRVVLSLLAAIMLLAGVTIPNVTSAEGETASANLAGELHNDGEIYVFEHLTDADLADQENITEKVSDLATQFIAENDITDTNTRTRLSRQGRAIFEELDSIVREEPSLEEFYQQLDALERKTKQLRTREKAYVLGAISVARYSGTLWAPIEAGGLSGWEYLPKDSLSSSDGIFKGINWAKVVLADLIAYQSGGTIWDALLASAIALLEQL